MKRAASLLARFQAAPLPLRVLGGFGLVLALCTAQSLFAFQTATGNVAADEQQYRSEQIASLAGDAQAALLQMEAGYRGYLLIGDEAEVASYTTGSHLLNADLIELELLSTGDTEKLGRWQTLQRRVGVWQSDIIVPGIALRHALAPGSASEQEAPRLANASMSQQDIDGIQLILDKAIAIEREGLRQNHLAGVATNNHFIAVLMWGTLAALGVGLVMAVLFARNMAQAIALVRSGERRYRQMFENNPSIKLLIDPASGAIIEANRAACAFYGYAHADLLRRGVSHINCIQPPDVLSAKLARIVTEASSSLVTCHRLASGEVRNVDIQSSTVDDVDGRMLVYEIVHDITERTRVEEALQKSEARYRLMFEGNQATQLVVELETGAIVDANPAACGFYGYSHESMLSMNSRDICSITEDERTEIQNIADDGDRPPVVQQHMLASGETRDVEVHMSLNRTSGRRLIYAIVHDITERKKADAALAFQARHDGLTNLANRSLLHSRLQETLQIEERYGPPVGLLLLDLDRFKEVNDTLGHQVGDTLLQQIGQRLQDAVRSTDLVARLGGDEFAVLLPGADATRAAEVAESLVRVLQSPFILEGQPIAVDASIGIAAAPEHGQDADTLLRCADVAMYQAKRSGTGVALYSAADDEHRPNRLALLGELRSAIEHDELLLHYQPKLDLRDGTLVGVEALVRWQHPQRGFLPPSEFITLAEQTGLIYPLSRWVLEAALKQHQAWQAIGINVPVAVNLSRRTLHDPELPAMVAQLLARWDVAPSALVVEITESSLMADPVRASENLSQLRALGVRISIDDFGTGYSSLASLKNLSVDELKIDQSFVQAMATDASSRAIVRAIIDLADALKLRVIAEGVEDQATWDVLAGLGCDVAQGYFLSRPIAAPELEAWVAQVGPSWLAMAERSHVEDALQERIRGRGARLTAEEEFIARKQAEAALRASEERNRLALQAAGMGSWAVIGGEHTWDAKTEALHGLAPETFGGTFAAFERTVHPDDWAGFMKEIQLSAVERRDSVATYRTVWPDGTVHWVENKGRALRSAGGELIRITGTSMDVTESKLAEAALRASEDRFRKQYKGIPVPTYSWLWVGDDFELQDYNDAAEDITSGKVHGWLGMRASERFTDSPDSVASLKACLTEQRTFRREQSYRNPKTGQERQLAYTYVFVPPQTVMVHREDVTEVKQAEQQRGAMAESAKLHALGQMTTGIAHNLNQLLMLVASSSDQARQALAQVPPNLGELDDLLTTTTQAALDGGESVKQLLMFTRTTPEQEDESVDLASVIREAAQLTAPRWRDAAQAEGRPITLDIESEGRPTIHGSPTRVRELINGLIFNAVDALPTGGEIRLRAFAEAEQAVVEVLDSGTGDEGTGLGLTTVYGMVEQLDGQIDVRFTPGQGTTFRITFALADASADSLQSVQLPADVVTSRPLRVLAVDDEPMMTKAVVRMLRPSGHAVSVAASGEQALEQLAGQAFDVVVSDIGMGPGMNGWELAEAVKRRWPNVRFLLATGLGAEMNPDEAHARGVDGVLAKPYRPVDLLQALARTDLAA